MMNKYGKLFLIPTPLGENAPEEVIPSGVLERTRSLKTFVVEEIRTARRYLSKAGLKGHIDELQLFELNEHSTPQEVEALTGLFNEGNDVGLISEAGLPAVADPGAALVELCHKKGIEVVPMSGPSSLMLALMGSGLNGQSFAFAGYLPAKAEQRKNAIKSLEKTSASLKQTELFIETPYRNDTMMEDLLRILNPGTRLCIAADLTLPDAVIRTKTVGEWKREKPVIGKRPCVFLILA